MQICDAVAVAGLLNATLVIPMFHLNSVWRDTRHATVILFLLKFWYQCSVLLYSVLSL